MKKTIFKLSFATLFAIVSLFAAKTAYSQVPDAINFQAIARDASGEVLANTEIMLRLSILDGSAEGTQVYSEVRTLTTNAYGSFSFQIGRDVTEFEGDFSAIDWSADDKFIKIDYDPTASSNFELSLGTIEFVTVPYAFTARDVIYIDANEASDGDVLIFNATTGKFEPGQVSAGSVEWNDIQGKPDFAEVATSGDYGDLINPPELFSGNYGDLQGAPVLNIDDWNTAYLWGNHAGLYRLVTWVPTWDDIEGVPELNIDNWNTAHSWGNHAGLYRPVTWVPAWDEINEKPEFKQVATSGDYNHLINTPTDLSDFTNTAGYLKTETQTLSDVLNKGTDAGGKNITNLANPTGDQDAATKAYVDALRTDVDANVDDLLEKIETVALSNGFFTDPRDSTHYKVVKIGNQIWMAENLAYKPSSGNYWAYNNDDSYIATYGYLYDWNTAMNGAESSAANPSGVQGICPAGWHLPSNAEWIQLIFTFDGWDIAGNKLKEAGTDHWNSPNGSTNESGFTALPGGYYNGDSFDFIGERGMWWSATQATLYLAHYWKMVNDNGAVVLSDFSKDVGFSVRCVKNSSDGDDDLTIFNGDWSGLNNTPTTIAGYGITDAFDGEWSSLNNTPITLEGYGITDATLANVLAQSNDADNKKIINLGEPTTAQDAATKAYVDNNFITAETDPSVPEGTAIGQLQYWDGDKWIPLPAGEEGQVLTITSNIPTWQSASTLVLKPPVAQSLDASNIESYSVQLHGNVNANGLTTSVVFEWGTTTAYGNSIDVTTVTGATTTAVNKTLAGLHSNTTYHYRIKATNAADIVYGDDKSFTTNAGLPTVTTSNAYEIKGNSARAGGNLINDGGSTVTAQGLCWSTSPNPTTTSGNISTSFDAVMGSLTENTIYYVRAYATNQAGTAYGEVISFNSGYKMGTSHAGGLVFYNDGAGGGMVCAENNQGYARWGCDGTEIGNTSTAINTGVANTNAIVAKCGEAGIAARLCYELEEGGFSDWYLPSKDELNLMYVNLIPLGLGNFTGGLYWSSSEYSGNESNYAWFQDFSYGYKGYDYKDYTTYVRAVRAF